MVGKYSDDFDVLAMAQELKSALDDFRKVVHEALDQRREVTGQPGFGKPLGESKLPVRIRDPTWMALRKTWVTSREACEYLRVTPKTLGRYRKKQLIPYRMIGGTCRYRYEELVAIMEKKSSTNNAK